MTTLPFGQRPRDGDALVKAAGKLPQDVAPARDLWPGIAARLESQEAPRRAPRWPVALAAGFLVAAVSALLTWGLMREPSVTPTGTQVVAANPQPQPAVQPVRYGANSPLGATQLAARDELLARFRTRLAELPPETRASVLKNLAVIQRAADEIGAAMAQDPASGLLTELLVNTYRKELDLYSQVVAAGDGATDSTRRT